MKLGFLITLALVGCAAAQNATLAADYEAAQLACIQKSQTKAEADACRCAVQQQFQRPCTAPGAGGMDGGK